MLLHSYSAKNIGFLDHSLSVELTLLSAEHVENLKILLFIFCRILFGCFLGLLAVKILFIFRFNNKLDFALLRDLLCLRVTFSENVVFTYVRYTSCVLAIRLTCKT